MPSRPDFFCRHQPRSRYDIERLMAGFETSAQAERYRQHRIVILRNGNQADQRLAAALKACGGDEGWCLSRACPVCARLFRRWLIGEALRLLSARQDLLA